MYCTMSQVKQQLKLDNIIHTLIKPIVYVNKSLTIVSITNECHQNLQQHFRLEEYTIELCSKLL